MKLTVNVAPVAPTTSELDANVGVVVMRAGVKLVSAALVFDSTTVTPFTRVTDIPVRAEVLDGFWNLS